MGAMIAHALAIIRNRVFGVALNPGRAAVRALYHDASEVLTGDLPAAVENLSSKIKTQVPGGDWGRESRVREGRECAQGQPRRLRAPGGALLPRHVRPELPVDPGRAGMTASGRTSLV